MISYEPCVKTIDDICVGDIVWWDLPHRNNLCLITSIKHGVIGHADDQLPPLTVSDITCGTKFIKMCLILDGKLAIRIVIVQHPSWINFRILSRATEKHT